MTRKQRRLALISTGVGILAFAIGLILWSFSGSIRFFNSPTDLVETHVAPGTPVRLGGLVATGTLVKGADLNVRFEVTDGNRAVPVIYHGIVPDLLRDGQGVVVDGTLDPSGTFKADRVLAKHDERYMPREVADALKKQGHWVEDRSAKAGATTGAKP
jgi:cytochrome c-type biogenesis protein CcmE